VIKAESEDRDSIGCSSRTTSAHDAEGMRPDTTAALRELNDRRMANLEHFSVRE